LTVGLAVFILASMTLIVAGPTLAEKIADAMQLGSVFEWTWKLVQWPVVFALVVTAFAVVYYFAPDAEQDWVWITPGAVFATLLWIAVSLGFKFYIATFADYNKTYGAIGGVMVLMLWFYVSGIALLVGAELNAEIEHASPYGKEPGDKVPGEKRKIGPAAERAYEERRARGEVDVAPFPDNINCELDRPQPKPEIVRTSDFLIGAAALLPAAIKVGRELTRKINEKRAA
jgi:membrane protein